MINLLKSAATAAVAAFAESFGPVLTKLSGSDKYLRHSSAGSIEQLENLHATKRSDAYTLQEQWMLSESSELCFAVAPLPNIDIASAVR